MVFLPDDSIFEVKEFDYETLKTRLRETAFLTKGLKIILRDLRGEEALSEEFHYQGGIKEFIEYLNGNKSAVYDKVIYCEGIKERVQVEVAMQHNDGYSDSIYTFVNNINTPEGGTHLTGFKNAVTKTFNDYARKNKFLKDSEENLSDVVFEAQGVDDEDYKTKTALAAKKKAAPQFGAGLFYYRERMGLSEN